MFPNPTKSNIQLVSSYIGIVYVKDSMGKVLQILEKKEDILNISLNDYSPGIYIIDTAEEKLKIVKQ